MDDPSVAEAFGEPRGRRFRDRVRTVLADGLERELKQKAAGIRSYTVVGVGTGLFVLVSKYGFTDVLQTGLVNLDFRGLLPRLCLA